ncbi:serine hydrolase domain-containing protein [Caldisalinibacter kiritimatiensis]|uniref:Penicillin-binding protein n=1 Tax=Caldisalinibacter kiritimatiensis TaxID=1304284 RepID=R1ASN0_9FIRM|nr:serine hydrolase [Caldisalinibacter kiritimatiensis]EOC99676.1 Penicillin-binding protein [Caldisalinibacter kiritimatiensis]
MGKKRVEIKNFMKGFGNMRLEISNIKDIVDKKKDFSGVVFIKEKGNEIYKQAFGYANRSYKVLNNIDTKFGIASGCKLFTAIAICQLADKGTISFETKLKDCLNIDFPKFDSNITIHHLLTHSSGIPDYFDEEVMNDFSELWNERPMYNIKTPKDFLPMFQNRNMDFTPGDRFKYNNAGYILLGLVVEEQTGVEFSEYIEKNIFEPCEMFDSGYFSLDRLPINTANGYIKEKSGEWKTNIYSIPIIGGPDGGAYTTVRDLSKIWNGIFTNKILSKKATKTMLKPHINVKGDFNYGYGVWISKKDNEIFKYYIMGEDPGVSMMSSVYPKYNIEVTIIGNIEFGTWDIAKEIQSLISRESKNEDKRYI